MRARIDYSKPVLERLPFDPDAAVRSAMARRAILTRRQPASPRIAVQVTQLRVLLRDGPLSLPDVMVALKTCRGSAKWTLRKLRLANEIEPDTQRRWKLVTHG